ncbi:hypothetical protein [Yersinia pseudotuberculosis]|uniref:hypothetical protein n=1 Tax=Yersinia pseudotuberculosis TaxID=633 RepID=UPI0005E4CEFF|nr:hypothetical protein [Yersinia pseudotuberculosis]CFU87957.1 Uncharacterised protein [Yersinia pseudotuberculosis]CNB43790.1 Uncharacterised protein [Yersinia pseudotuberculosis]CNB73400.1 Uncharacterised protein [Yersinia pseudotuberculosis]CRY58667.1 Uncharacterised protein [Yersinia pseudotuberculosis]SUB31573.1 Uncharacterised protein [Yersinia pseudotuberculosis]
MKKIIASFLLVCASASIAPVYASGINWHLDRCPQGGGAMVSYDENGKEDFFQCMPGAN